MTCSVRVIRPGFPHTLAHTIMLWAAFALLSCFLWKPALAEDVVAYDYNGSFEDAVFDVEGAILDEGLVIDNVSHVGDMLNRTAVDVGSDVQIFEKADVFQFCSAVLSRKAMEADPMNIAHCPYGIFVIEMPGEDRAVKIGYRTFPSGPMQDVQKLLDKITRDVIEN